MNMLEGQILLHKAYAEYWTAVATTGAAKKRELFHGVGPESKPFTDEEKIENALETALRHIHLMRDLVDKLPPRQG